MTYTFYSFIADAVLVLILLLGIFFGWRRGFVRTVAKPVKIILSLVVAFSFCGVVGSTWIQPVLQSPIEQSLTEHLQASYANMTAANAAEELPSLLKMAAGIFNIDITEVAQNSGDSVIGGIVSALIEPVTRILGLVVACIVLYIAARLALWIVMGVLSAVFNIGILGIANRSIGVVFSLLFAIVIAWLFVCVAEFAFGYTQPSDVIEGVRGGFLYGFFNNYTPLDILLSF